jgi:hypothetical protein
LLVTTNTVINGVRIALIAIARPVIGAARLVTNTIDHFAIMTPSQDPIMRTIHWSREHGGNHKGNHTFYPYV